MFHKKMPLPIELNKIREILLFLCKRIIKICKSFHKNDVSVNEFYYLP